jgi:hypothetical protein
MQRLPVSLLLAMALVSGCVALGWRFGPGSFSAGDTSLFSEPPVVERRGKEYFLAWTQGSYPFFFQPDYKAMDGRLVFALVATASSGNLAGRHREMKIEGADSILALLRGGAYWWELEPEPEGRYLWELWKPHRSRLVALRIVDRSTPTAAR